MLLHVVDASSSEAEEQIDAVRDVLRRLDCAGKETWIVFNKWDRIPEDRVVEARHLDEKLRSNERSFRVSAHTGAGLEKLREAMLKRLQQDDEYIELFVPHQRGDVVAYVQENGQVRKIDYQTQGVYVEAALSPARIAKLKAMYAEGFPAAPKEAWEL